MALFSSFGTRFTNSALLILRRKGLDKLIYSKCYSLGHVNLTESLPLKRSFPEQENLNDSLTMQLM